MKESPTNFLGTVRKSLFDKIVIHHLMQFFQTRNFLKHKRPPTNFFGTVRQRSFERKSWYPPPSQEIFDDGIFLKTEGVPYEVFRYSEKINFRQNRDTPSYAIFLFQNFFWKKGPLGFFLVVWDKKSFERKSWSPGPSHKIFR